MPHLQRRPASVADEIWSLLYRLSLEQLRRHWSATVAEFDLSEPQAHLLHELRSGHSLSQREVANRLHCDASNVTGLTDRLEARGLVERRPEPADRRVKALVMTGKGRTVAARLERRLFQAPHAVTQLSLQEQRTLRKLLCKVADGGAERRRRAAGSGRSAVGSRAAAGSPDLG